MNIIETKNYLKDELIALLERSAEPIQLKTISKSLKLYSDSEEYFILKDILNELIQTNVISKSARRRYSLKNIEYSDKYIGELKVSRNYGFIVPDNSNIKKIIINFDDFEDALVGDEVEVDIYKRKIKKVYGKVTKIIKRANHKIKGKLEFIDTAFYLVPQKREYQYLFPISEENIAGANHGDEIEADFQYWDYNSKLPIFKVTKVYTKIAGNASLYDRILTEFDLPDDFSEEVLKAAEGKELPSSKKVYKNRLDLRKEVSFTIDPDDAKDYDDALSIKELNNGNYEIGIHIADVSHYIEENSIIDIEARERGNSTYLADRVVPMLPEILSNNLCSLVPNKLRFAHSVILEIDKKLKIQNYEIVETIIKSKKRFTYDEALKIIDEEGTESKFGKELKLLNEIAIKLRKERFKSGGIDFETSEIRFKLDENKEPVEVKLKKPTKSTQLVEEMMLLANKIVANHFNVLTKQYELSQALPAIYRVHEDPEPKILKETIEFISSFGKKFQSKNINSAYMNDILHYFKDKPEKDIVNKMLVKSMTKAYYDNYNHGHYGLGFDDYTHFTSPIRRYADLIVHRLLKEYGSSKPKYDRINNLNILTKSIGKSISITERKSIDAERASNKQTQSLIMKNHIGEEFNGTVTGLLAYGLFVQVDDLYSEGMLHIKEINDDYYNHDEKQHVFIGKSKKNIIRIGSRIKVKVINVNIKKRFIDFSFIKFVD